MSLIFERIPEIVYCLLPVSKIVSRLTNLPASQARGQRLTGIQAARRIKQLLEARNHFERRFRKLAGHHFHFLHADAVLSGEDAADLDA